VCQGWAIKKVVRPRMRRVIHGVHDGRLCFQIHRAGGFVQNKNGCAFSGRREPAKSAGARPGEAHAALSHKCVVTVGQTDDELWY
jgi:hypothetical protein